MSKAEKRGHPPRSNAPELFEMMLDNPDEYGRPKCDGDLRFTEYDSEDPEQADPPSRLQADQMCDGCPLRDVCAEAALVQGPKKVYHGIRSGMVYENGRRLS